VREAFGFDGTPVRFVFRDRSRVELEKRPRRRTATQRTTKGGPPRRAAGRTTKRAT
jgi:hypothetical protein